ncbi:hypothetical protein PR202_ga27620 [Eleusine coracana subsp. coracana]|uniref:MATH domain-containing protein n=1 Tax=Eleusine coracana subsp. coracana TaxID=191504 RepID=A0AAV5DF10_ELECO|nr:hypothetical protein PR202_ga27598 [Eleusine coracana subsp. coracana]GJN09599.1 hypothetical protein PR202_ga27620 [Eleusine coracana subsp. coracana]
MFEIIIGYTLNKDIDACEFIRSGSFTVGGCDWSVRLYPDEVGETTKGFVAIVLELISKNAKMSASPQPELG